MSTRTFLMLQGPHGSFFKKLGAALRKAGHRTLRVNFNGGDLLHYASRYAIHFRGTLEAWPETVGQLAQEHGVTDLVVYGDCRPLHDIAIRRLQPLGVRVHVFEEGYFRPNWITLEEGGVNGFSSLPRDPDFYRAQPIADWSGGPPIHGSRFLRLVRHTISYYGASALMSWYYRHYRSHRPRTYQTEGLAWLYRLGELWLMRGAAARRSRQLAARPEPYFLILLQLLGDSQIVHHSPYHDMYEFLNEVLVDFAEHAPAGTRLIVKNHPLDNGLNRYASFLSQKARSLGLIGGIDFIDGGHLPSLLRRASGVVTVNSTAGLSALHHGCPVRLMGDAIYALPGLVSKQPLAEFWRAPQAPDRDLYQRFASYVIAHTQIYGGFYRRAAIRLAMKGSVARLLGKA